MLFGFLFLILSFQSKANEEDQIQMNLLEQIEICSKKLTNFGKNSDDFSNPPKSFNVFFDLKKTLNFKLHWNIFIQGFLEYLILLGKVTSDDSLHLLDSFLEKKITYSQIKRKITPDHNELFHTIPEEELLSYIKMFIGFLAQTLKDGEILFNNHGHQKVTRTFPENSQNLSFTISSVLSSTLKIRLKKIFFITSIDIFQHPLIKQVPLALQRN
jgi:hypothetical protein